MKDPTKTGQTLRLVGTHYLNTANTRAALPGSAAPPHFDPGSTCVTVVPFYMENTAIGTGAQGL